MSTNETPTLEIRWDIARGIREMAGLDTTPALAEAMGVDPSTVSRVIRGRQAASPQFIAALLIALNVRPADMASLIRVTNRPMRGVAQ